MGVYINMEMPSGCAECRLSTVHSFNDRPLCDVLVEYMSYGEWETKRLDNCPLGEIPPHGRLIDADVAEVICFSDDDCNGDFCDGILFAADWISKQPTIIPADPEEEGEA